MKLRFEIDARAMEVRDRPKTIYRKSLLGEVGVGSATDRFASIVQKYHRNHADRGFTLVEILAVIIILSVLAGIAIPSMLGAVRRSRVTTLLDRVVQKIKEAELLALERGSQNLCFSHLPVPQAVVYPVGSSSDSYTWEILDPTLKPFKYEFFSNDASGTLTVNAIGTATSTASTGFVLGVVPIEGTQRIGSEAKCIIIQDRVGNRRIGTDAECGLDDTSLPPLGNCR